MFSFFARLRQTAQRNGVIQRRGAWVFGQSSEPLIGRSRGHWKFPLDMHSIGDGYCRLKAPCARASVDAQPSRSAPYLAFRSAQEDMIWRFAIVRFSARRDAPNMPTASRDLYLMADSSGIAIVRRRSAPLISQKRISRLVGDRPRARATAALWRRAVSLDERRRIVDSRRDPRTYHPATAAWGPRHTGLGPLGKSGVTVAPLTIQEIDNPGHVFEADMMRGAGILRRPTKESKP
jgi:hypothetical protein